MKSPSSTASSIRLLYRVEIFDNSFCFISTSSNEGFGLPPLEALSRNCIPIIGEAGGNAVFSQNLFNCLTYDTKKNNHLSNTLKKLYENDEFDIIVNISEDGWFGQSIGPEQHFVHSIFRAIESGKYVIRSANNGIAAIVNPLGIVEEKIKFKEVGYIDFSKMRKVQPTIFSKYGNKIFGLIILLYIFLIFSFNKIKNE